MSNSPSVRLLQVEPDIGSLLSSEERRTAEAELVVPTLSFGRGAADVLEQIDSTSAFAAMTIEGILTQELRLGDQLGTRLLGPGDIVQRDVDALPMVLNSARFVAATPAQIALLGDEFLLATRRWPRLLTGLLARGKQQADRLAAQLVICQLPRVDQRVLAMMWLLAESWGRVTSAGTRLSMSLTHDVLGALVGARRPTITLALRELTERGAIARQDHGWLLLQEPPQPTRSTETLSGPALVEDHQFDWSARPKPAPETAWADLEESFLAVRRTVTSLREQHARNAEGFAERMGRLTVSRQRYAENRRRVARQRLSRQRSPS